LIFALKREEQDGCDSEWSFSLTSIHSFAVVVVVFFRDESGGGERTNVDDEEEEEEPEPEGDSQKGAADGDREQHANAAGQRSHDDRREVDIGRDE